LGYDSADLDKLIGPAGDWAAEASKANIPCGAKPQVGAIAQRSGYVDGKGVTHPPHVAVVERVNDDGTIVISESNASYPGHPFGDPWMHEDHVPADKFTTYIYVRRSPK
jgi:surface antigen